MSSLDSHRHYYNAVRHEDDSYILDNGEILWYNRDGEIHREDGPAIVWPDGKFNYFLHDIQYSYVEWKLAINPNMSKADKVKLVMKHG